MTDQKIINYKPGHGGYAGAQFERDSLKLAAQGWLVHQFQKVQDPYIPQMTKAITVVYTREEGRDFTPEESKAWEREHPVGGNQVAVHFLKGLFNKKSK